MVQHIMQMQMQMVMEILLYLLFHAFNLMIMCVSSDDCDDSEPTVYEGAEMKSVTN